MTSRLKWSERDLLLSKLVFVKSLIQLLIDRHVMALLLGFLGRNHRHDFCVFVRTNCLTSFRNLIRLLISSVKVVWILIVLPKWVCKLLSVFPELYLISAKTTIVIIDVGITTSSIDLIINGLRVQHWKLLHLDVVDLRQKSSWLELISRFVHCCKASIVVKDIGVSPCAVYVVVNTVVTHHFDSIKILCHGRRESSLWRIHGTFRVWKLHVFC